MWTPLLLAGLVAGADSVDWRALTQKPHAQLPLKDIGLRPLPAATRAEWDKARAALRDAWLDRLGRPPVKPDSLDVQIEQAEKLDGYTRQLLSFHSEGGDRVRAYLLVPDGLKEGERRPAVVVFHPTTKDTLRAPAGLGQKPEQALAVHLARRGYVALSPECYILKDPAGWAKGQAAALEQRRPGWTGLGKMTFDAARCVDFLETLPQVDKGRVGCIGHSLGAKEVLYAMAFEPRYQAGVFSEGGIGLRMSNWTDAWYLTEKMKPHIPELENHQVLALVAPRPFLIFGGDSADGDASWAFVKAVLPIYELFSAGDRVGLVNHRQKHTFPPEARRTAYRWLDHWLRHVPTRDEVGD